jgi:hypothetical protein
LDKCSCSSDNDVLISCAFRDSSIINKQEREEEEERKRDEERGPLLLARPFSGQRTVCMALTKVT